MTHPRIAALAVLTALALGITGCADKKSVDATYPIEDDKARRLKHGTLTGEGLTLFGSGEESANSGGGTGIGVNGFLWRASLDTISFMPIASADPFGGTIITDWYEDPAAPGERNKLNVTILDKSLRADGVKVAAFKQKRDGSNWRDAAVDPDLPRRLEETILTRARDMRLAQLKR